MGEVKQRYCDGCKAEYTPATYSQGSETGTVELRAAVWTETGSLTEGAQADLCPTCYEKMLTWVQGKISTAATAFAIETPITKAITPPTL